jgi:hypothetical protein
LGRRRIYNEKNSDDYRGGIVRVYKVKENGWVKIYNEE